MSLVVALAMMLALAVPTAALAHPEHGGGFGGETFPGEGVIEEGDKQHDTPSGHLPPVSYGVTLVGKGGVTAPAGTDGILTGRVADVAAHGTTAFLTAFRSADCRGGGAWMVDITNPAAPREIGFLPTTLGSYAGEGSQVFVPTAGPFRGKPLFIHQNETCNAALADRPAPNVGGINIWDVSNVNAPRLLVAHAGDLSVPSGGTRTSPTTVHSAFAWNSSSDGRAYVALVDNQEATDVDIMDITDPTAPVMVNDTLDLVDLFGVDQPSPAGLRSIFNHDMAVFTRGQRDVMTVNYWDGGYVLLDVSNPRAVTLIAESDFAELDEQRLARGHEISPEGNAHQSELSPDWNFMIGTDEDFAPLRSVNTITSGPAAGTTFTATPAGGAGRITPGTTVSGTPTFVGLACGTLPAGSGIALVERGACAFQVKLDNVAAAGYSVGIVINSANTTCLSRVNMLASGTLPFLFVDRAVGLRLLGQEGVVDPCTTAASPGTIPALSLASVFDGWGYVRLFRTQVPSARGTTGTIRQVDTYAIPESQDLAFASGFGDLSVHEVAMDPRPGSKLAYLSYYAGGLRVLEYSNRGLREVGAFIDQGGNNFWGVEVHRHPNGQTYVLASDRDFGLYIFQTASRTPGGGR